MMTEDRKSRLGEFTYGLELEWSDVDAKTVLDPDKGKWSPQEWTIVNSDGTANDPRLIYNDKGGEINTTPTDTIDQQIEIVKYFKDILNPKALYRGSLQVHIGVPGLKEDAESLVDIFKYVLENEEYLFTTLFPREAPKKEDYPDPEDWKIARNFNRQKNLWTKRKTPESRITGILNAKTPKEFYDHHHYYNARLNKFVYHIGTFRAAVNLRSVFEHGTVEFRCFPNTVDVDQIRECVEFSRQFIEAALYNPEKSAQQIHESRKWNFPVWPEFNLELEKGFKATQHNPHDTPI